MHRVFGLVLALGALAACGKSRLAGDDGSGGGWDEPTEANGFHHDSDRACDYLCLARHEAERPKHAVRTRPAPRSVTTLREALPSPVCERGTCVVASSSEPVSAVARADRLFVATRDANGHSTIESGGDMISAAETDVRALAALGSEVCWIDANERVRCGRDAASIRTVTRAAGLDARFLAVDDQAFYVVRGGWIARLGFGASSLDAIAKVGSPMRDLALAGGHLYWTEQGEPRVECLPDGTMPSCTARGRTIRHPHGSLRRVRLGSPRSEIVAGDLEAPDGLLVANGMVYVATGRGLVRVAADGEGQSTVLPTAEPAIGRPALDPVSWTVYVQTRKNAGPVTVMAIEP